MRGVSSATGPVAVLTGAAKTYQLGEVSVAALRPTDLRLPSNEFVVIVGPSGSGKSTLLNLLGGLDRPTAGSVVVDGVELSRSSAAELAHFRRSRVAFVFQQFNLFPGLTALENVDLAAYVSRGSRSAEEALEAVGLGHRLNHFPRQLSGGEQQRVGIARALVTDARLILADEPTGELDVQAGKRVLQLLRDRVGEGRTVVVVTHDMELTRLADRIVELKDGMVVRAYAPERLAPETVPR